MMGSLHHTLETHNQHLGYGRNTFVVCIRNCTESTLPSCVPDLQFDILIVKFKSFEFKVYTNSTEEVLVVCILCESRED